MEKHGKNGMGIEKLKTDYAKLQKKHKLPSFEELNQDFNIEKIAETETEFLLREVRKFMGDRLANYMRFVENLLNPANAPMFIFSFVKALGTEDRKALSEIYKGLMKLELKFIQVDLESNDEKEAEFVRDSYHFWQKIKKDTSKILKKINDRWDEKPEPNNKGYFG